MVKMPQKVSDFDLSVSIRTFLHIIHYIDFTEEIAPKSVQSKWGRGVANCIQLVEFGWIWLAIALY